MKIYTSYFANMKALSNENIFPISIARYSPRWYNGPRYTTVAPYGYMLNESCSHEQYLQKYEEILSRLNALGLKHHARIDFRKDREGNVFVIDVNLMPGLGPIDHFSKCFLLTRNFSYVDTMKMLVLSAYNEKK